MNSKKAKTPIKIFDFFNGKSPPIGMDHSPPAPSLASSSCVSDVTHIDDDEKEENRSQEEVSSPRSWLALNLSPTKTCDNIQRAFSFSVANNGGGNPCRDIDSTARRGNKRKTPESSVSDETRIICVERKRPSCSSEPNKNERPVPRHEEEEKYYAGISTEWDSDTSDEHRVVFRHGTSSRSYVLNGDWNNTFVKGQGLKVGGEIGMLSDTVSCKFPFIVLLQGCSWHEQCGG